MERLIKYAFEKGYCSFTANYKEIDSVMDVLCDFGAREVSMILLVAEEFNIDLETLVLYANDVVRKLKAKKEAQTA